MPIEIEAKFTLPDTAVATALAKLERLDRYHIAPGEQVTHHDTYFDTPDRHLYTTGYAFRRREFAAGVKYALKETRPSAQAIHHREELEVTFDQPRPLAAWPDNALKQRVQMLCGDAPVCPFFALTQERLQRAIYRQDATTPLAILSVDTVHWARIPWETPPYRVVEVELTPHGTEVDLQAIVAALKAAYPLPPARQSKFEHGMTLRTAPIPQLSFDVPTQNPAPAFAPQATLAEVARALYATHYRIFCAQQAGVERGDDVTALHDMRVASRRMRTLHKLFAPYLALKPQQALFAELRHIGEMLGQARDLDVLHLKTATYLEEHPAERAGFAAWEHAWRTARETAQSDIVAYLGSARYHAFQQEMAALLQHPLPADVHLSPKGNVNPYRLDTLLPVILYQRLAHVMSYRGWFCDKPPAHRYHRLRITTKHLRYTLQFFQPTLGPTAAEAITLLKMLQNHLGAMQDAVVARERLYHYAHTGTLLAGDVPSHMEAEALSLSPALQRYAAHRQAEITHLRATFPALWKTLATPQTTSAAPWLTQLVTQAVTTFTTRIAAIPSPLSAH